MFLTTKMAMPKEMQKQWQFLSHKFHAASDKNNILYWMLIRVSPLIPLLFIFAGIFIIAKFAPKGYSSPFGVLLALTFYLGFIFSFIRLAKLVGTKSRLRFGAKRFDQDLIANEVIKYEFQFPKEHWFIEDVNGTTCIARVDEDNTAIFYDDEENCICNLTTLCKNKGPLLENWLWYKGQFTKQPYGFSMSGNSVQIRSANKECNEESLTQLRQELWNWFEWPSDGSVEKISFDKLDNTVKEWIEKQNNEKL